MATVKFKMAASAVVSDASELQKHTINECTIMAQIGGLRMQLRIPLIREEDTQVTFMANA